MQRKGRMAVLAKGGSIREWTDPEGDDDQEKRLTFLIGCAYGKGITEELGPLDDGGPLGILEDDFDVDDEED